MSMIPEDETRTRGDLLDLPDIAENIYQLATRSWAGRLVYSYRLCRKYSKFARRIRQNPDQLQDILDTTRRKLQIMKPMDNRCSGLWSGFEGTYYGWNPTWNYEFVGQPELNNFMLQEHEARLKNQALERVNYILAPDQEDDVIPLKTGIIAMEAFFKKLLARVGVEAFKRGAQKYVVYDLREEHLTDREVNGTLFFGTSCFCGLKQSRETLFVFLNAPPFMERSGLHKEAYITHDQLLYEKVKTKMENYIEACENAQRDGKGNYIFGVNPEDGTLTELKISV